MCEYKFRITCVLGERKHGIVLMGKKRRTECELTTSHYHIIDMRPCESVQGLDVNNENQCMLHLVRPQGMTDQR